MQRTSGFGWAGRLLVTNPALVTNDLAGFSCDRHRMCVRHCMLSRYHKRLFTDRQTAIHDHNFATIGCHYLFPTRGNTGLDKHTAWQLYTIVIVAYASSTDQSL